MSSNFAAGDTELGFISAERTRPRNFDPKQVRNNWLQVGKRCAAHTVTVPAADAA